MGFTIEVKREEKDREDLKFADLQMFHRECYGGRIKVKGVPSGVKTLVCQRCGKQCIPERGEEGVIRIIKTAIDGQERKALGLIWEKDEEGEQGWVESKISVVQKIPSKQ